MNPPVLKTDNFTIRAFEEKDLKAFAAYRAVPEVAKYQSWTSFSYEDALALFNKMDYRQFGSEGNWYQLAIAAKHSDSIVGDLAVHFIDKDQVEIGFTVSPNHQRKQVAEEASRCLLEFLFLSMKKHRVIAVTDALNLGASRLLEKLGFRREGHFIKNIFFKGSWGDEYLYAMLREEFQTEKTDP